MEVRVVVSFTLIPGKNIATLTACPSHKNRVLVKFSNNFLRGSVTCEIYLLVEIIQNNILLSRHRVESSLRSRRMPLEYFLEITTYLCHLA